LQGEYIISTRVRCGRSLQGYPFNPCLTEAQYKEMEEKVSSTLSGLEGELKGQFYPLTGMTKEVQQKLIDDHFLFKEGDRFLQVGMNLERISNVVLYNNTSLDGRTLMKSCSESLHQDLPTKYSYSLFET
jgi:creatine kinase